MNYVELTNDSLTMMYEAVRGALASDDAAAQEGAEPRFQIRSTPGWTRHAADLEAEMIKRGMIFKLIDWHEDDEGLAPGPDA
jgi:hypothetical protein